MPISSNLSDERSKVKVKFFRNVIEIDAKQPNRGGKTTSLFYRKKKYRKSFWEGRVAGTPNFAFCDSLPWLFDQSIFNSDPISKLCRNWNSFSVETNKVTTPLLESRNSAFKLSKDRRRWYHFFVAILPLITDYNFCEKKFFWVFSLWKIFIRAMASSFSSWMNRIRNQFRFDDTNHSIA